MKKGAVVFLTLLLALCIGCERSDKRVLTSFNGLAMTMHYRILVGMPLNRDKKNQVDSIICETLQEIDRIYNKWNPQSELSQLNRCKAGQKMLLSEKLETFLKQTGSFVALTEGKFDPTIGAVQNVWKKALEKGTLPEERELQELSEAVGWSHVHISDGFFWKDHDRLELDLGGIAKGYAIDLIVERLNAAGYPDAYVEWGGEIRTSGNHPDQRPWRIFISDRGNPDPASALAIVDMQDNAAASSGDYLQYWTVDGVTYCHIFDPRTRRPLSRCEGGMWGVSGMSSVHSVSLIARTCMAADALATAAMVWGGREQAEEWLEWVKGEAPEVGVCLWWVGGVSL